MSIMNLSYFEAQKLQLNCYRFHSGHYLPKDYGLTMFKSTNNPLMFFVKGQQCPQKVTKNKSIQLEQPILSGSAPLNMTLCSRMAIVWCTVLFSPLPCHCSFRSHWNYLFNSLEWTYLWQKWNRTLMILSQLIFQMSIQSWFISKFVTTFFHILHMIWMEEFSIIWIDINVRKAVAPITHIIFLSNIHLNK